MAEEALDVGVVAVHFERAAAVVHLDVADFGVAADEADARFRVAGEADFDVAVALDLAVDGFDRAVQQELAALDDADAGAAVGQLGEDVAGDEDRLAHRAELFEQRFHFEAGAGVEAAGGFVEDQDGRVVDERLGQAEALLHAAGEAVDEVVALVREVEQFEHVADDGFAAAAGDLVGDGEEVQKLPDLHAVVDAEVVGHVADAFADADRVAA